MTKPNTDGGWRLPAVIDPPTRIGVCVPVPDEPEHRRAFLGALLELARWWNWQRDPARRGREAARVWFEIWRQVQEALDEREGCGVSNFDVRQNSGQPCRLEKTTNGGVTWAQWADLRLCRPDLPALVTGGDILVPFDGELIPITDLPPGTDTVTTSDERRSAGDDEELAKCLAALNAALVFRRLHEEAWRIQLMPELAFLPPMAANAVITGILGLAGLGLLTSKLILNPTAAILTWLLLGSITQARCTSISL
jgi:hypothetical protein